VASERVREAERMAAGVVAVGFPGRELNDGLVDLLRSGLGGVVLFDRNAGTPDEVRSLVESVRAEASAPLVVAVDHEGGRVQRLRDGFTTIPSMREIGSAGDRADSEATRIGRTIATELAAVGIDLNFAPVVDVDSNPDNPVIGDRSFGADPAVVARLGVAMLRAMQEGPPESSVRACAKHFPGHGDTDLDSHRTLPHLRHTIERLERIEWPPFRAAIDANVAAIMTAHVVFHAIDATRPATLSPLAVEQTLRHRLGFRGAVISDDLRMRAVADVLPPELLAVAAIRAGCDLLLVCDDLDAQRAAISGVAAAIVDRTLPEDRVQSALGRVAGLRRH